MSAIINSDSRYQFIVIHGQTEQNNPIPFRVHLTLKDSTYCVSEQKSGCRHSQSSRALQVSAPVQCTVGTLIPIKVNTGKMAQDITCICPQVACNLLWRTCMFPGVTEKRRFAEKL